MKTLLQTLARTYFWRFPIEKGKWRLWVKLLPLLKTNSTFEVELSLKYGIRMRLNPHEVIDRFIYYWGCWEPNENWVMRQLLRPGDTFVDVGADIGYFTLLASRLVGPGGDVIACEPVPTTLQRLKKNLELNRPTNVVLHDCAISDRPGIVRISRIAEGNAGTNTMRRGGVGLESWDVPSVPLDQLVPRSRPIRLLKIDVEGAELLVLNSFMEHLKAGLVAFVLCEVTESFLQEMGTSRAELLSLLSSLGYRAYTCDHLTLTPLDLDDPPREDQLNVLFSRGPLPDSALTTSAIRSAPGPLSAISNCVQASP